MMHTRPVSLLCLLGDPTWIPNSSFHRTTPSLPPSHHKEPALGSAPFLTGRVRAG